MRCISVPKPNCGGTGCRLLLLPESIANLSNRSDTMNRLSTHLLFVISLLAGRSLLVCADTIQSRIEADRWTSASPRAELRPAFEFKKDGGPFGHGSLLIRTDEREGLD